MFQAVDEFVHAGNAAGLPDFLVRGRFLAPAQVILYRAGKQSVFLEHHGDRIPQSLKGVFPDRAAVYIYRAIRDIIESGNQLHQRALGSACLADDAHGLSRLYMKGNVGEHIFGSILVVFKVHMLKPDIAMFHLQGTGSALLDVDFLTHDFRDTFPGSQGSGGHEEHIGEHHQ